MTTNFEDDLKDWLRGVPASEEKLRQLRNLELPARPRFPWLGSWAAATAALVLLMGVAFIALSRPPSVGPTVIADGPVIIRTQAQPFAVCDQAGISGTLVADATYGLALERAGRISGAIWPFGYSARRVAGSVVLIGPSSTVVAHEGDQIVASGAAGPDGTFEVECDIQVTPVGAPFGAAPTGGIDQARAIAIARDHVPMGTMTGAVVESPGALPGNTSSASGAPRWLWAVSFSGDVVICDPLGACQSPRSATATVYLDYMTGSFIETSTDSSAP